MSLLDLFGRLAWSGCVRVYYLSYGAVGLLWIIDNSIQSPSFKSNPINPSDVLSGR